jgi:hypothetical protein
MIEENKINKKLIEFIIKARKKGFLDNAISKALTDKSWPKESVNDHFYYLDNVYNNPDKNKITLYLDDDLSKIIEKRAKKNLTTVPKQIEDILRRSCVRLKFKNTSPGKIDDLLINIFSRKNTGRKRK